MDIIPTTCFATLLNAPCTALCFTSCLPTADGSGAMAYLVVGKDNGEVVLFPTGTLPTDRLHCIKMFNCEAKAPISCAAVGDLRNVGRDELVIIQSTGMLQLLGYQSQSVTTSGEAEQPDLLFSQLIYANVFSAEVMDADGDGLCELVVVMTDRVVRSYRYLSETNRLHPLNKWEMPSNISGWSIGQDPTSADGQPHYALISQCEQDDYVCVDFGPGKEVRVHRTAGDKQATATAMCQLVVPNRVHSVHSLQYLSRKVVVVDQGHEDKEVELEFADYASANILCACTVRSRTRGLILLLTVDPFGRLLIHGWRDGNVGGQWEPMRQYLARCEVMQDICQMSANLSFGEDAIVIGLVNTQGKLVILSLELGYILPDSNGINIEPSLVNPHRFIQRNLAMRILHNAIRLTHRGLVQVKGRDAGQFLRSILSQNVGRTFCPVHSPLSLACLISPRSGKIMKELLVYDLTNEKDEEENFLLEATSRTMADLLSMFIVYRLRNRVTFRKVFPGEMSVYFSKEMPLPPEGGESTAGTSAFEDPRAAGFGYRVLSKPEEVEIQGKEGTTMDYMHRRLEWGIPEGRETGNEFPLFMNMDIMNGINYDKEKFPGSDQVRYFGKIKRRLLPFRVCLDEGSSSLYVPANSLIVDEDGFDHGKIIKYDRLVGIAVARLDTFKRNKSEGWPLMIWDMRQQKTLAKIELYKPKWWPEVVPAYSPKDGSKNGSGEDSSPEEKENGH